HEFAADKYVHIVIPPSSISSAGEEEFSLLMNKARTLDYRDREQKAYCVLMDFIPALSTGDLRRMGDVMWEIEFRGSKRAEIEHHSFELYHYMNRLRKAGLEFVGMSSVGPSIAIITALPADELKKILSPMDLTIAISTAVDNCGQVFV
ncbi:MAG: GHMP kinase, partial [Methanospirillum sp.]|nr:GHMP kinase [Methanospirillum sp.]